MIRILASAYYLVMFFQLEPQYSPLRVVLVKWKAFGAVCKMVIGDAELAQWTFRLRALIQRKLLGGAFFMEKDAVGMVIEWCSDLSRGSVGVAAQPLVVISQQPSEAALPVAGTLPPTPSPAVAPLTSSSSAPLTVGGASTGSSTAVASTSPPAAGPAATALAAGGGSTPQPSSSTGAASATTPRSTQEQQQVLPKMDPAPLDASCMALFPTLLVRYAALGGRVKSPTLTGVVNRLRAGGLSESAFMMLTTLLEREIHLTPFSDPDLLQDALSMLTPYYLWPQPYAAQAFHMLKLVSREVKCPGVAWRRGLERVFPFLTHRAATGKELDVVLLAPPDSAVASALEAHRVAQPSETEVLVGSLLSLYRAAGLSTDLCESRLLTLGAKKLQSLYDKTREAMDVALEISSPVDAAVYLDQRLDQLRRAAEKHAPGKVQASDSSAQLLCGVPWQIRVSKFSFDVTLAGREIGGKIPRRNATKVLRELILDYGKVESSNGGPVALRILVEGGDWEFHHVLSSYVVVSLAPDTGELLRKRVKISFHLLSTRIPSALCDALSANDPWFARRTAMALRSLTALSATVAKGDEESQEPMSADSFLHPPHVLRSMLDEYLSTARYRNEFKVWQCECWQKSTSAADLGSQYVIPFILSATFGRTAQARMFQLLNEMPLSVGELAESRAFKFKPPVVSMKAVGASLKGLPKEVTEYEARPWEEVVFQVVPEVQENCAPRFGVSWMEMSAMPAGDPASAAKKKRKQAGFRAVLHHTRRVEIVGHKSSTFDITLDGVPYGPFSKVVISPCTSGDPGAPDPLFLTIPIRGFASLPGGTTMDD